jgi:hypothetical protein
VTTVARVQRLAPPHRRRRASAPKRRLSFVTLVWVLRGHWSGSKVHGVLHISGSGLDNGSTVWGRTAGYGLTGFNASLIFFPAGSGGRARVGIVWDVVDGVEPSQAGSYV